jgi:predicted GNAT family acetyltransferase
VTDVQAYLRAVAADDRQALATGPFDVFIDCDSAHPFSNYAIPRSGAEPSQESVSEVVVVMQRAARVPRLEFLPAAAPAAEKALVEFGFTEELRTPVMTCHPDDLKESVTPDGVLVRQLGPDAEREQIEGLMRALALAFDEPYDPSTADSAASRLSRRIAVVAYADEEIAGGGMCLESIAGVVELVGIGVRDGFRGRGIGGAITFELARLAFDSGVDVAFLTPGDEDTARIYERAGFSPTEEMLHLSYRT